jgi:hypothetical protein
MKKKEKDREGKREKRLEANGEKVEVNLRLAIASFPCCLQ